MNKRRVIAFLIAFTLMFMVTALWTAETNMREGDTDANIISDGGAVTGKSEDGKKRGNRVARILTSPFRAMGRLFGRGKDKNQAQSLSEKDVAKFESAGVVRVEDQLSHESKRANAAEGSAREHLSTGRTFLAQNRINEAIAELSLAVSLDPRLSEANSLLGVAYDHKGLRERAKESYDRAVLASPEDAQALNNLGYSLYQSGNYRAALDRLKRAAKLAPNDQRILNNLALVQCKLGKFDDAYKSFARAGGELNGHLNTAAMLERAGRDTEAIKHYEAARRLQPGCVAALRRLADLYQFVGRNEEANQARNELR